MNIHRIVVVTREVELQQLARQVAQEVFVADDLFECADFISTIGPDLIILDDRFSPDQVREFISKTDKNSANVPLIAVSRGEDHSNSSADYIQAGAIDYLQGRKDYGRLKQIVRRVKNKSESIDSEKDAEEYFIDDFAASIPLVGNSKAIRNTLRMIKLVAASRSNPVLIVGETGTGKELAAKAVHTIRHPDEPFVAVNCAALTTNLLESELFGHVKGSFTGADREKTGLLEMAGSGSLFLDEISEMPTDLQAKLLRVLQEKTFRKVGGTSDIICNATIIASSNRNLKDQVRENRFRRDLYYRLNICPINIAPLRAPERREDVRILAEYFLKTSTICPEKQNKITSLGKLAVEALEKHDWPGNVRELKNAIDRAILLETTDKIGLSSIVIDPSEVTSVSANATASMVKDFSLEKAERELIIRALEETGWQKTRAASLLGITRVTLYAKVKQYNIEKNSHDTNSSQVSKSKSDNTQKKDKNEILTPSSSELITV